MRSPIEDQQSSEQTCSRFRYGSLTPAILAVLCVLFALPAGKGLAAGKTRLPRHKFMALPSAGKASGLALRRRTIATGTRRASGSPGALKPCNYPMPHANVLFDTEDTTTSGAWQGVYGGDGFDVIEDNDPNNPICGFNSSLSPAGPYLTLNFATAAPCRKATWQAPTTITASNGYLLDTTVPVADQAHPTGMLGVLYGASGPGAAFTFETNFVDGNPHRLAVYAFDQGQIGRDETINLYDNTSDPALTSPLDSEEITDKDMANGVYLVWTVTGDIMVQVVSNNSHNAVVNGVFIGGPTNSGTATSPGGAGAAAANLTGPGGVPTAANTPGNPTAVLTWTADSADTAFDIYRATTSGAETLELQTVGTTRAGTGSDSSPYTYSYTDTGLTYGTAYYYEITGVNSAPSQSVINPLGGTPPSDEFSVTPEPTPPSAPTTVDATEAYKSVVVTWSPASNATGYNVYAGAASGSESSTPLNLSAPITGTSYTDTTATVANTTYYYKVASVNQAGTSALSASEGSAMPILAAATHGLDDKSTGGNWKGTYGGDGYYVIGDTSVPPTGAPTTNPECPAYVTSTPVFSGGTEFVWAASTTNAGALQNVLYGSANRTAGTEYSATSEAFSLNFVDDATPHHVAFYALDWGSAGRAETITISDKNSGAVIGSDNLSGFGAGVYANYTITGPVSVSITKTGGNKCVLSGLFFGTGDDQEPPAAGPGNPTATAGDGQVALAWAAPFGATSFDVYRGTSPGGESSTPINASPINATAYTDTGLADGKSYYYTVAGVDAAGTGDSSAEVSATPTVAPPADLTASSAAGNPQVVLSWNAAFEATSYNVYRGTSGGAETSYMTGVTGTTYTDTNVTNGPSGDFTYDYKVTSVAPVTGGGSQESGKSNEATVLVSLPAPAILNATPGNAQVVLNWTAATGVGITGYDIYRGTTSTTETAYDSVTGAGTLTYTDTGVSPNTVTNGITYWYTVAAVNAGGPGIQSSPASATPTASAASLVTVDKGSGSGGNGNWIGRYGSEGWNVFQAAVDNPNAPAYLSQFSQTGTLTNWANPATLADGGLQQPANPPAYVAGVWSNSTGFTVSMNIGTGGSKVAFYILDWGAVGRGETIKVTDFATGQVLVPAANYTGFSNGWYVVFNIRGRVNVNFATTAGKNCVLSGIFFGGATSTVTPNAPTGLTATAGNEQVTLAWNPLPGATSYNIYRATSSAGEGSMPYISGVTAADFTDTGLTNGTTYYYTVAGVDRVGGMNQTGSQSVEANARPILPAPTGLTASLTDQAGTVVLTWNAVPHAGGYIVWQGNAPGGLAPWGGADTTSASLTATSDVKTYYYVTTAGVGPQSGPSNEVSIIATSALAAYSGDDTTTGGTWIGTYGKDGFDVLRDLSRNNPTYPGYVDGLGTSSKSFYTWQAAKIGLPDYCLQTGSDLGPNNTTIGTTRIAGVWYSATSFTVDLTFKDAENHPVELYLLDWNNAGRAEAISVTDQAGTPLITPVSASNFGNGTYYKFTFQGNVDITFANEQGKPNAVLSGIFFN